MITVNQEKCIGCRQCENICHTKSILINEGIHIDYSTCSTCTQCIAICPSGAISWDNINSQRINRDMLPAAGQVKEFLKARRSIRRFQDKPIDKDTLRDIAVMSKYAPTNNYEMDAVVIDDKELISSLERECINFISKMYKIFYKNKVVFSIMRRVTPAVNSADRVKTERTLKRGTIFQNAPALIIITADKRIAHTEASCQYALYNMSLYAQALGIGSCVSGAGKMILSKNKRVKKLLRLPEKKDIAGILFLGCPAVSFPNKVEGISPKIYWNN